MSDFSKILEMRQRHQGLGGTKSIEDTALQNRAIENPSKEVIQRSAEILHVSQDKSYQEKKNEVDLNPESIKPISKNIEICLETTSKPSEDTAKVKKLNKIPQLKSMVMQEFILTQLNWAIDSGEEYILIELGQNLGTRIIRDLTNFCNSQNLNFKIKESKVFVESNIISVKYFLDIEGIS